MIYIFSERNDASTNDVIKFIKYYFKKEFYRFNSEDILDFSINDFNISLINSKNRFNFFNTEYCVWFRRPGISMRYKTNLLSNVKKISSEVYQFLINEHTSVVNFIFYTITHNSKYSLGDYFKSSVNKLYVLSRANKFGLLTPSTYVFSSNLCSFNISYSKLITKPISEVIILKTRGKFIRSLTKSFSNILDKTKFRIINGNTKHGLSLFQTRIEKLFEVRAFYIESSFYCMAIFSQLNDKTSTDFRNYDFEFPNRLAPFQLPDEISYKLDSLMQDLKLNTGSIDLIASLNKENNQIEFYFLEINPVGQYGMVSIPCNYNLDLIIAQKLCQKLKI